MHNKKLGPCNCLAIQLSSLYLAKSYLAISDGLYIMHDNSLILTELKLFYAKNVLLTGNRKSPSDNKTKAIM